nr:hypothetical protein [uncultured Acinetobacter sp.]
MRKLKFMANCENKHELQDCTLAQNYVANLLSQNLSHYGFQTLPQSGAQVAVSVDQHALPLAVNCQSRGEDGHLVCEITSYPNEEQDWLERITEQSLLNQLAQAVENTLKEDQSFSEFEWKG